MSTQEERERLLELRKKIGTLESEAKPFDPNEDIKLTMVYSSIAGHGSGAFHTQIKRRRAEQDRIQRMQEEWDLKVAQADMQEKVLERQRLHDEETQKRREERKKRKLARKRRLQQETSSGVLSDDETMDSVDDDLDAHRVTRRLSSSLSPNGPRKDQSQHTDDQDIVQLPSSSSSSSSSTLQQQQPQISSTSTDQQIPLEGAVTGGQPSATRDITPSKNGATANNPLDVDDELKRKLEARKAMLRAKLAAGSGEGSTTTSTSPNKLTDSQVHTTDSTLPTHSEQ